jgi:hypothetical protein
VLEETEKAGLAYETIEEAAEKVRNVLRVAAIERSKEFTVERFRDGILSVIGSIETRERKEGRLVNLCRRIDEKRVEYGVSPRL